VRRRRTTAIAGLMAAVVLVGTVVADAQTRATLRMPGRVRDQADTKSRILAMLPEGATVSVLGQSGDWLRVRTPDGTTGWLWIRTVRPADRAENPARDRAPVSSPPAPPLLASALVAAEPKNDDLQALRAEVEALRKQQAAISPSDFEALRAEVRALAAAQRDLERRLHVDLPVTAASATEDVGGSPAGEAHGGSLRNTVLAVLLLAVAAALGWLGSRLALARRERRYRLRF